MLDYGPPEGVRIFEGLHPDVVLIQEFNVGGNSAAEIGAFVTTTFGPAFTFFRESGAQIPNAIISRYPIAASGTWVDPAVANRSFAYAKLTVPGPHPLWAISLHLLTTGAGDRATEVAALVKKIQAAIPAGDYMTLGGDFNTATRTEDCIKNTTSGLAAVVATAPPYPADGSGNDNTSLPRSKPHDWVLANTDLSALSVPVVIGARSYSGGLVFDSRVFTPLADVAPVLASDSAAMNTQHMPVVRDFALPP
jgi:endonuclease/exonuclease/phosphatase family metal-dependent hydrolase